ncbi:hypothetical protein PL11201_730043 [Planktothrix sp. PCC 11201]|nr:hypothetical protein PL11201_730043 [Planktothrix sp. PCC 11201]
MAEEKVGNSDSQLINLRKTANFLNKNSNMKSLFFIECPNRPNCPCIFALVVRTLL